MPDDGMSAVVDAVVPDSSGADVSTEVDTGQQNDVITPDSDVSVDTKQDDAGQQVDDQAAVDDGRTIPQAWRELFKKDSKLRGVYFSDRAFRESFPEGPKQAKEIIQKWDSLGGDEGIQAFEQERGNWEALDQQFTSGDPKFVEHIAQFSPDAFQKMVPTALDQLAKTDKASYDHLMSRVIVNTLTSQSSPISKVYQALAANPDMKPLADELAKWYGTLEDLAAKQPERKIDPDREKFEREKAEFNQSKQEGFVNEVRSGANQHITSSIEGGLAKEFLKIGRKFENEKKTDPEGLSIIFKNCDQAIAEVISKDPKYSQTMQTILATGDRERALKFARAKVDKVAPEAISKTFNQFYKFFNRSTGKRAGQPLNTSAAGQSSGTVPLGRMPSSSEIDWNRTSKTMPLDGKAYLKNRKELVTF